MKPDIAKKWAAALRSGKYAQGTGRLRDGDSFCCLGVLCDLYDNTFWGPSNNYAGRVKFYLPPQVVAWAGLLDEKGTYVPETRNSEAQSLSQANDEGLNFEGIADLIESNVETL